ncbi:Methyltransferase-like protein 10 [Podochytrium sp. JEL0797]|nr:Methyltransferase-like protein 10 [Podochytrium sp. JEL0797]
MEGAAPDFATSKLGTKQHWDEAYDREINNFEDHGDIGEIWFGENSVVKMMEWVETKYEDHLDIKTVDLGCGNGHLVFEMAELGFTNLTGVDYSPSSILLAQKINAQKYPDAEITFEPLDFMPFTPSNPPPPAYNHTFELALDKGTFDAISLANGVGESSEGATFDRNKVANKYAEAVAQMLNKGEDGERGILLITSCNWTEKELVEGFKEHFKFHSRKKYPTFTFGGVEGQTVVTVAFALL